MIAPDRRGNAIASLSKCQKTEGEVIMKLNTRLFMGALLFVLLMVLFVPAHSFAGDPPIVLKGTLHLSGVSDPECHCPGGIGDCICKIPRKLLPKN